MRKSSKNIGVQIIFLGLGSYNMTKSKKSSKGIFWTISNNNYLLMDTRTSTIKESSFTSYDQFVQFCSKNFPDSLITT